jgi:hypothetical protein
VDSHYTKLENFLFNLCMNCNAKRSSANIFPRAAHYMSKSRMWLASRGLATPDIYIPTYIYIYIYIYIKVTIAYGADPGSRAV